MRFALFVLLLAAAGCGPSTTSNLDVLETRSVKLPDGTAIQAEVAMTEITMRRGMMFREALPANQGMLFVHNRPGTYSYWMYNVKIPLDIIWMDAEHRIVEISADTPPCRTKASECPNYGGHYQALFVLELGGGQAARHHLQVGETLSF